MLTRLFGSDSSRTRRGLALGAAALAALAAPAAAWAEEAAAAPPVIDTGDTAWVLTSAALVLMMTLPGLALFYGGLVRAKNILNVFMQCFISAGVVGVIWVVCGYSLAFGTGNAFIGDFSKVMLNGVTLDSVVANFATPPRNIPEYVFVMFQGMFAIITPALILGAIAERMKFSAWLAFITVWILVVYCPIAHMVWGSEGWIFKSGAIDFAGGLVVHMSSGFSAILAAVMLGKRRGFGKEPMPPHSLPLCMIGAGLLWMGWFGFNAGSALAADGIAANAFVTTNTAAAAATLGWIFIEWLRRGKPTVLGAASGAVAGLVSITPGAGFVTPVGAIAIGFLGGIICFYGIQLKEHLGADDALDVVGVHGVGGTWGALATGIFATKAVNAAGADGLLYGNPGQLLTQAIGVGATLVYCFIGAFILLKVTDVVVGLRVADEDEFSGLDLSQHSERAYMLGSVAE